MIISIYFKVVYTKKIKYYDIETSWNLLELYNYLKPLVLNDFNINNFELLDSVTSFDGETEKKPKIEQTDVSLKDLYGDNIHHMCIYIRPI